MEEERIRRRVLVAGRVQGVWFRGSTEDVASQLGVAGWVRNLPDGRVEAVFEGGREAVAAAVGWAAEGPTHARVDEIEVTEEPVEDVTGFTVR